MVLLPPKINKKPGSQSTVYWKRPTSTWWVQPELTEVTDRHMRIYACIHTYIHTYVNICTLRHKKGESVPGRREARASNVCRGMKTVCSSPVVFKVWSKTLSEGAARSKLTSTVWYFHWWCGNNGGENCWRLSKNQGSGIWLY